MRILVIGDIIGKPGRRGVQTLLPSLRDLHDLDLVIANGENAAGGFGLTLDTAQELFSFGVDIITSGNHIWDQREIVPHLDSGLPIIRPLNYPPNTPGSGYLLVGDILVINLLGRTFMQAVDCPFLTVNNLLAQLNPKPTITIVDFHAEATSEKQAMGWYLDGRVSAVVGTHTHVGTIDTRILPNGTAYVTDAGMVGPINSVIGSEPEDVLFRFLTQQPRRLQIAGGPVRFNSVMIEVDPTTGTALDIHRIDREVVN